MGIAAAGTIADIIIAIMAERDINDAALGEMLHVADIVLQGEAVLNTEHDALSALPLIAVKIGRSAGYAEIIAVLTHDFLYLVEDEIGILQRSLHIEGHLAAEALAYLRLRQISHHGGSILMSIGHLVKIYEDAGVAMIELDALREEHRSITMGIERKDALMQLLGCIKIVSLINQPLENLQSFFFQPFRMPLHTENLLILATLYSLDNGVRRSGDGAQMLARLAYRLMVERVDKDLLRLYILYKVEIFLDFYDVGRFSTVGILAVLYQLLDILAHLSAQRMARVWMPRQMPSIGIWRLKANRVIISSAASRS